jgi:hypothetical protein
MADSDKKRIVELESLLVAKERKLTEAKAYMDRFYILLEEVAKRLEADGKRLAEDDKLIEGLTEKLEQFEQGVEVREPEMQWLEFHGMPKETYLKVGDKLFAYVVRGCSENHEHAVFCAIVQLVTASRHYEPFDDEAQAEAAAEEDWRQVQAQQASSPCKTS